MSVDLIRRIACCGVVMATGLVCARQSAAQDPSGFLSRLDANGNGMLDPNEVEGRMGSFIQGIARSNPRIDLSKPIPISTLTAEFARMREERMQGGGSPFGGRGGGPQAGGRGGGPQSGGRGGGPQFGGRGGGPQFGGRGGGPGGGPQWGGRGSSEQNPYEYRQTQVEPLIPGFGEEDVFSPPLVFGAEAELFTIEVTERDREEARKTFRTYDRNNDGKVSSEEMRRNRYAADLPMYDKNRDGVITMNEMEYRYARRRIENTQAAGNSSRGRDERSRKKEDEEKELYGYQWGDRKSYRRASMAERMPEGLPDWFSSDDANVDGQVAMREFSSSWNDDTLKDFGQFDLNQDGLITPSECLKAVENGAVRGEIPEDVEPESTSESSSESNGSTGGSTGGGGGSDLEISKEYYDYFKTVIDKYDTNKDGVLTANEWSSMSKNIAPADANGDARVTVEEYARFMNR